MSKIAVLRNNFEGTTWKREFAECVIRLRPDMNPDAIDEISDVEFQQSKDLEPELAALRWTGMQVTSPEADDPAVGNG